MSSIATKWAVAPGAALLLLASSGAVFAQSLSLQQCANGTASSPRPCRDAAWTTGSLQKKNSHYVEGDAVPLRIVFGGLAVGSAGNVVTIEWDTTEAGVHAYDYLRAFDASETLGMGNDPCSGAACSLGAFTTFPIPVDAAVSGAGVTQSPGVFVMFGATITSVSAYQYVGTYLGRSSAAITITFTADSASPVLAVGGHLARTQDWGDASGASFVPGALQARLYSFNGKNKSQTRSLVGVRLP